MLDPFEYVEEHTDLDIEIRIPPQGKRKGRTLRITSERSYLTACFEVGKYLNRPAEWVHGHLQEIQENAEEPTLNDLYFVDWVDQDGTFNRVTLKNGCIESVRMFAPDQSDKYRHKRNGSFEVVSTGIYYHTPKRISRFMPVPKQELEQINEYLRNH